MDKYIIINKETNQIVCKAKNGRHYRQSIGYIGDGLVICTTTKGRAEKERDYLNQEYNKGWKIEKVEPIVFKDNREDIEKRMEEYENEIKNAQKQAVKEFAERLKERMNEGEYMGEKYKLSVFRDIDIDEALKEFINE